MKHRQKPRSASQWMVALKDAPGDETLREEHRRWLADSEDHLKDWDETLRTWQLMAMTLPAHIRDWSQAASTRADRSEEAAPATGTATTERDRTDRLRPPGRRLRRPVLTAGAIAAAVGLMFLWGPKALLDLRADHRSATGEIRLIELEDGSRLQLAPESAVTLAFDPSVRRVELLRGEAFFDVVTEAARPFQVRAGVAEAVVVGTRFAVSLAPERTKVAVQVWSVRVDAAPSDGDKTATSSRLAPGDVLEIGTDGDLTKRQVSDSLVAAWRDGLLVAQHRPLGELIDVLNRYFNGVIIVADPQLAQRPMTGIYRLSDPKVALHAMADAQGATIREISPWILVLSSR